MRKQKPSGRPSQQVPVITRIEPHDRERWRLGARDDRVDLKIFLWGIRAARRSGRRRRGSLACGATVLTGLAARDGADIAADAVGPRQENER
jgi:hypothetical protein